MEVYTFLKIGRRGGETYYPWVLKKKVAKDRKKRIGRKKE